MYRLTTIKGLLKRIGFTAFALAALISLSDLPTRALPAETNTFTYKLVFTSSAGLATGQTLGLNFVLVDDSVKAVRAEVKVIYKGATILLRNYELNPKAKVHTINISRNDLSVAGEPDTARVQPWVEVKLTLAAASQKQAQAPVGNILVSTYDVITDASGETVLTGLLLPAVNGAREAARR